MNSSKLSYQLLQCDGLKVSIFSMSSQWKWKSLAKKRYCTYSLSSFLYPALLYLSRWEQHVPPALKFPTEAGRGE